MRDDRPVVLVVDDNPGFIQVMTTVLGDAVPPVRVEVAEHAGAALQYLERSATVPAFVVLDYHLPDMDAPDVLCRVRAVDRLRQMPVFVLSQADWATDEAAALAAGADRFGVKPSRIAALREIIAGFLQTIARR